MVKPPAPPTSALSLKDRVAFCIALEELAVKALSCALSEIREWAPADEVAEFERVIRLHRVGILKRRAVMGAFGIDV